MQAVLMADFLGQHATLQLNFATRAGIKSHDQQEGVF